MDKADTFKVGAAQVRIAPEAQQRVRLTRDQIVTVALQQTAEHGLHNVSMRSIARELGTGPASLYAHVANKDDLEQLIIDRITSLVDIPAPDPSRWAEQVRGIFRGLLEVYRQHPGAAQIDLSRLPVREGGLRTVEGTIAILIAGGIHPRAAVWFCGMAATYVSAVAAEESIWAERALAAGSDEETIAQEVRDLYQALPTGLYPMLAAHVADMTGGEDGARFEFGLDVLVAGLEVVSARMS